MAWNPKSPEYKEHMREYMRKWMKQNRDKKRAEYLRGKSCVRCGGTKRLYTVNPGGRMINGLWNYSEKKIREHTANVAIYCSKHYLEYLSIVRGRELPKFTKDGQRRAANARRRRRRRKKKIAAAKEALLALGFELK